jgi:hypothetical protein
MHGQLSLHGILPGPAAAPPGEHMAGLPSGFVLMLTFVFIPCMAAWSCCACPVIGFMVSAIELVAATVSLLATQLRSGLVAGAAGGR